MAKKTTPKPKTTKTPKAPKDWGAEYTSITIKKAEDKGEKK